MQQLTPASRCSDPVLAYAPDGSRVYYAYIDIKVPPAFPFVDVDVLVSHSDDDGQTWIVPESAIWPAQIGFEQVAGQLLDAAQHDGVTGVCLEIIGQSVGNAAPLRGPAEMAGRGGDSALAPGFRRSLLNGTRLVSQVEHPFRQPLLEIGQRGRHVTAVDLIARGRIRRLEHDGRPRARHPRR